MRILAKEECHSCPSKLYNGIMNQPMTTMTARSQTRGIPATFRTNNPQSHSLPRQTIRDLKGHCEPTLFYSTNTGLTYLLPTPYRQGPQSQYWLIQKTRLNKNITNLFSSHSFHHFLSIVVTCNYCNSDDYCNKWWLLSFIIIIFSYNK